MCRGSSTGCVLLGSDPSKWSPYEPLPGPPEIAQGLTHLEAAIRAAAAGDLKKARDELSAVQSSALQQWYIEHAQVAGTCRLAGRRARPVFEGDVDKLAYPARKLEKEVFTADGFRCRYCQRRVLTGRVLTAFHDVVGETSFPMGKTNASTHGAALVYRAVADHVVARKRGGRTDRSNLVTACYPCNFGKADYSLDEIGLVAPRSALVDEWDGLESLMPALLAQAQRVHRV